MTIFRILSLRYQWEEIVRDYKLNDFNGTIDNLESFITDGAKGNRFRNNFKEAYSLAETIVYHYGLMESLGSKLER
jgi:hypothetical protein